jgi:hypothetical protein
VREAINNLGRPLSSEAEKNKVNYLSRKQGFHSLLVILLLSGLFVQTTHVFTHLSSLLPASQPTILSESAANIHTQAFNEHDCGVCENLAHLTAGTPVAVFLPAAKFASETFRTRTTNPTSIAGYSFAGRAPPVA